MTNKETLLSTLLALLNNIENNTHLSAVCDGLIMALPLTTEDWCHNGCISPLSP